METIIITLGGKDYYLELSLLKALVKWTEENKPYTKAAAQLVVKDSSMLGGVEIMQIEGWQ